MRQFADLVNLAEDRFHGTCELQPGTIIRKKCEAKNGKRTDNYSGYLGVTHFSDEEAYRVIVSCGSPKNMCLTIRVAGDSLTGTDSARVWFSDLNVALAARDKVRSQITGQGFFLPTLGIVLNKDYNWPVDRMD
jgi:hypothetical protein